MSDGIEVHEPVPGDVIGDYRVESLLGRGGMGSVFKATQLSLGRHVALKVLLPEHAVRPGAAVRFEREAKVSAQLRHPNAIEVFDFGAADGCLYLAMELLVGKPLRAIVGDGRITSVDRTVQLVHDITGVLAVAHERGIVHRDLKPENVFLEKQTDETERVVVVDFGLAFVVDHAELGRLTKEGMITGTPDYISPEQAVGNAVVGPPADVYALGCMMFEMFLGITPFHGHPMRVLMQQTHGIVPTFDEVRRDVSVSRALEALVMSMVAKQPDARPTAREIHAELGGMRGRPTAERARERIGLDGRAARMVSEIRPPASQATTLSEDAGGEAEVAVVGVLHGETALALATNSLHAFIVSAEQPIGDAAAIYAPGADLATLVALRAAHPLTPIVTDAAPSDADRVPSLLRAGIDDVVAMPVRPEELGRRLWKLVRRARKSAQRKSS